VCMCMCVCVCVGERETERLYAKNSREFRLIFFLAPVLSCFAKIKGCMAKYRCLLQT